MLSTKHLVDPEEIYNVCSNAQTSANGLKLAYNTTDQSLSWIKHAEILIKIALLEQLAKELEIRDPSLSFLINDARQITEYLPIIMQPMMDVYGVENIKIAVLNIFHQVYNELLSLYPQLQKTEPIKT